MSARDPQAMSGAGGYRVPQGKCGCGHIEGVHLVTESGRGACGASVGAARCPCKRYAPGGTALELAAPDEPTWKVALCDRCFRPVIWTLTTNAARMAVDSEPVMQGGTVALQWRGDGVEPLARVLSVAARFARRNLRTPHEATCPGAERRRTRARSRS